MAIARFTRGLCAFLAAASAVVGNPLEARAKPSNKVITPQVFLIDMVRSLWTVSRRSLSKLDIVFARRRSLVWDQRVQRAGKEHYRPRPFSTIPRCSLHTE